jgi:hypothetical protein
MIYKLLPLRFDGTQIIARIDDDGLCRMTLTDDDEEYLKWLDEENEPLPSDDPNV